MRQRHRIISKSPDLFPIAIIGASCRFPGALHSEQYWELLTSGGSAIGRVPQDRLEFASFAADDQRGGENGPNPAWGGFLPDVDLFDASFFSISPREAPHIDPQQRLMLELSWEALEDAGLIPAEWAKTSTGVFCGAIWEDYSIVSSRSSGGPTQYSITGGHASMLAARISYAFGFQGPSMVVNTTSSSSLVAVHLACQSLWMGESVLALAGGVNLMLIPETTIALSKLGALSADGRSKPFDGRADGYVRGEGGGVVVLKPLSDAVAAGDPVHCVIRASAVNNDGRSAGLTAPNLEAQKEVLRQAYQRGGIDPSQVHYVEAHGTGTSLGDEVEAKALGEVMRSKRPRNRPLRIGSVKPNLGHLEAAAGVASLIKVAFSIRTRTIPPTLNFEAPNESIDSADLQLRIQTNLEAWPNSDELPLAGVSAFGLGGTNCHIVLQGLSQPEASTSKREAHRVAGRKGVRDRVMVLSASTVKALKDRAKAIAGWMERHPQVPLDDLCYTTSLRQTHHLHRLAFVCRSLEEARDSLRAFSLGHARPSMWIGASEEAKQGKPAFVCSESSFESSENLTQLWEQQPAFRKAIQEFDRAISGEPPQAAGPVKDGAGEIDLAVLRSGPPALRLNLLARMYTLGYSIDWSSSYPNKGQCLRLPPYPWQRDRYWIDRPIGRNESVGSSLAAKGTTESSTAEVSKEGSERRRQPPLSAPTHSGGRLEDYLCSQISRLLLIPCSQLDPDRSFIQLGMDSLVALELESALAGDLGTVVPVGKLLDGLSIRGLARRLRQQHIAVPPVPERKGASEPAAEWETFKL